MQCKSSDKIHFWFPAAFLTRLKRILEKLKGHYCCMSMEVRQVFLLKSYKVHVFCKCVQYTSDHGFPQFLLSGHFLAKNCGLRNATFCPPMVDINSTSVHVAVHINAFYSFNKHLTCSNVSHHRAPRNYVQQNNAQIRYPDAQGSEHEVSHLIDAESPGGSVDEAHCCDTSRSLGVLISWHNKATSSERGCKPSVECETLYRMDVLQYTNRNQNFSSHLLHTDLHSCILGIRSM